MELYFYYMSVLWIPRLLGMVERCLVVHTTLLYISPFTLQCNLCWAVCRPPAEHCRVAGESISVCVVGRYVSLLGWIHMIQLMLYIVSYV